MVSVPIRSRQTVAGTCGTCHVELAGQESWFVPWGEHASSGRQLCFVCLMTAFRIDTQVQCREHSSRREGRSQAALLRRPAVHRFVEDWRKAAG